MGSAGRPGKAGPGSPIATFYAPNSVKLQARSRCRGRAAAARAANPGYSAASSRSSRRRILPTLVLGSSLRNSMMRGCL